MQTQTLPHPTKEREGRKKKRGGKGREGRRKKRGGKGREREEEKGEERDSFIFLH